MSLAPSNKPIISEAPSRITLQKKEAGLLEGIGLDEWCTGPAIDSAASVPVFCERDRKRCMKTWKLQHPVKLSGVQGSGECTEGAWMKVGKHYVKGLLSATAPESIVPVRDLVNPGGCMMFVGSSCVLIDKDGDTTHMIPGTYGFFYMPISAVQHVQYLEVHEARVKCERQLQEHARRMHIAHVKRCLIPKCPLCEPCLMGKMRKGDGDKGPSTPKQDLEICFDLIGPLVESNDGDIYKLVGCEAHTGYGHSIGLTDKASKTVLRGVQAILARMRTAYMKLPTDKVTVRFHSDDDKSFLGAVKTYIIIQRSSHGCRP